MTEKDQVLVERTLAGDRNAFGDLVERYQRLVYGVLLETVRRPDEVDDLMQDVFCSAYEKLGSLRQRGKFAGWLAQIASNAAVQWVRQRQRREELVEREGVGHLSAAVKSPDEALEEEERTGILWDTLDMLSPALRRIVVLYYLEGCTYQEIGRFLGVGTTTVRWRLHKAQKRLGQEMGRRLGKGIEGNLREKRMVREKILAALPVVVFFDAEAEAATAVGGWAAWGRKVVWVGGTVGLVGLAAYDGREAFEPKPPDQAEELQGGFRVLHREVELPRLAFSWDSPRPRAGQTVRLEVAGPDLPEDGTGVELHYITDPLLPVDRTVAMRREGDAWVAELAMPDSAARVFFYAGPTEGPLEFERGGGWVAFYHRPKIQRYAWSLAVHDAEGKPWRGADLQAAIMAEQQGRPEAALAAAAREVARHPDNYAAQYQLWKARLDAGGDEVKRTVAADMGDFLAVNGRDPEAWRWALMLAKWRGPLLAEVPDFIERFPDYEKLYEIAYYRAAYCMRADPVARRAALADYVEIFPRSPYIDEAYRALLNALVAQDRPAALRLAEDLVAERVQVPYDAEGQRRQEHGGSMYDMGAGGIRVGSLPVGLAHSVLFEFYLQDGDAERALALARDLVGSGLPDPWPYYYIARRVAGPIEWINLATTPDYYLPGEALDEATGLAQGRPDYPRQPALAAALLEAGLPWADPDHVLTLPGLPLIERRSRFAWERQEPHMRRFASALHLSFIGNLAACQLAVGAPAKAVARLREFAAINAGFEAPHRAVRPYWLWGQAHERLGQRTEAAAAYREGLALAYGAPVLERALAALGGEAGAPQYAPGFALTDLAGHAVGLDDFRGKPLMIVYAYRWTADRFTRDFLRTIGMWRQRLGRGHVAALHINASTFWDGSDRAKVRDEFRPAFPVAVDDGSFFARYRVYEPGGLLLVDAQGRLVLWADFFDLHREPEVVFAEIERKLAPQTAAQGVQP